MENQDLKNCWNCFYHDIKHPTIFGVCTFFERHKKEPNKEIPANVVDKGCKCWKTKFPANKP
jgi:hypothetical protein